MKKLFRTRLEFSKAELQGRIAMDFAGLNIAPAATDETAKHKLREQFGLFGGSSDANKFYPDIAGASDVIPKPEDFVDVPFRLISATIVGAGSWKATDFSNTAVLQGSVGRLANKPVYYDHDTDLLNWVGIVKAPKWTESFTNSDGTLVPAGIDGIISIDAKTNPKIARGVLIGSVFSNSVTVEFMWEMSHEFSSEDEFNRMLGSIGTDGKMVRRVVTSITDYHESSLVWLGADPFAKLIDGEGNLVHIDKGSIQYDKATETEKNDYCNGKKYSIGFAIDKNVLHLSRSNFKPSNTNNDMKPEVLAALIKVLGLSEDTKPESISLEMIGKVELKPETPVEAITEEQKGKVSAFDKLKNIEIVSADKTEAFEGAADKFNVEAASHVVVDKAFFTKLKDDAGKVAQLEADKVTLQNEKASLEGDAKLGKDFIGMQRKEAVRLYKVAVGGEAKADAAVVGLFEKATPEELKGLLAQYTKGTTAAFSGKCKSCGSEEFEFRSSVSGEGGEGGDTVELANFDTIYNKFAGNKMHLGK